MTDNTGDPPEIRASDTERAQVADRLTAAVGEGRLTLDEFTQRVDAVYTTATRHELDRLTADLPAPSGTTAPVASSDGEGATKRTWKLAILGGSDFTGRWRVPLRSGHFAFMGGSTIDLCDAVLDGAEVEILLVSVMGGNDVIVPKGVRVEVDSTDILGGSDVVVDESDVVPGSPVVRIRSITVMGGNDIRHPKKKRRMPWH